MGNMNDECNSFSSMLFPVRYIEFQKLATCIEYSSFLVKYVSFCSHVLFGILILMPPVLLEIMRYLSLASSSLSYSLEAYWNTFCFFKTVDTYYRRCSSAAFIGQVSVPLLCISALDDPVCTREAIPWDECRYVYISLPSSTIHLTRHG